jgi:hypothetical protein
MLLNAFAPEWCTTRRAKQLIYTLETTILRLGAFALAYGVAAEPEGTLTAFVGATVIGNLGIILIALLLISRHAAPVREER